MKYLNLVFSDTSLELLISRKIETREDSGFKFDFSDFYQWEMSNIETRSSLELGFSLEFSFEFFSSSLTFSLISSWIAPTKLEDGSFAVLVYLKLQKLTELEFVCTSQDSFELCIWIFVIISLALRGLPYRLDYEAIFFQCLDVSMTLIFFLCFTMDEFADSIIDCKVLS